MQDPSKRLREQMERQRRQAMGAAWEEQRRRGGGGNGGGCLGSLGRAITYLIVLAILLAIAVACSIFVLGDPFQFT